MLKYWLRAVLVGGFLALSSGSCNGRSFGQVGPPITIPPPFGDPFFSAGATAGTVVVSGAAGLPEIPRPGAKVSVLNLTIGIGSIVVTGNDGLYQVTIPGVEGDIVEITIEFDGELLRSEFSIVLTP